MASDHNHRVYSLTEADRKNLKFKRETSLTTNAALIADAIDSELVRITDALLRLGFSSDEETRPARLPLSDVALAALREASEATGLPQSVLLVLSLRAYCGDAPVAPPDASKPKTAPKTRKPRESKESTKTATGNRAPRETAAKPAQKAAPKAPRAARKSTKGGAK